MIKKLRMKFILINMSIVTIMLCIILGLIYQFTKIGMEAEGMDMLQNIALQPFRAYMPGEIEDDIRLPYFTIQIDAEGNILATAGGYYDLSDEAFLTDLLGRASSSSKQYGILKDYNLRYYHASTPINEFYVFADMSSELTTLNKLVRIMVVIGILSFLGFFVISFFLARWAVKPVEEAWIGQRQFVADASHELKTPLTVIMTNAELLQTSEYGEGNRQGFADSILIMSKQMRKLIEQMLELARSDAVETEMVFRRFFFSKVVQDSILPFEAGFYEKGLRLDSRIQEGISVNGSEDALRQVVNILLDNAQKYCCPNAQVMVELRKQGRGKCLLRVSNEGAPIPPEELKKLFKRFYRADKARSRTGNFGLGLAIAESIILRHRGKIWAESKGGFNSFFVELPII